MIEEVCANGANAEYSRRRSASLSVLDPLIRSIYHPLFYHGVRFQEAQWDLHQGYRDNTQRANRK